MLSRKDKVCSIRRQISREESSVFTWKIMYWPSFDPNTSHQSNHQQAKRLTTEFMDFKWVFERLHHDSFESNVNRYGKPAKIITIIKALYQGWACKVYASSREWFTQIAMSNKVVLGRAGDLLWDKGEDGATGSAIATHYTFTCDEVPRRLPNTSKRGFVVSYEKKPASAMSHSTPAYFQKQ